MNRRTVLLALCFIIFASQVPADGLRTAIATTVVLDASRPETVVTLRYNEAVGVFLPTDQLFIKGVEFELRIPSAAKGSESSIQWALYSGVSPAPSLEQVEYDTTVVAMQVLPSRVSLILKVPVLDRHDLRSDAFATVIPKVIKASGFPVLFKLSGLGKGFTAALEKADFKLIIRPIIGDEGGIRLNYLFPEGGDKAPVSVFLDDRRVDDPSGVIVARKGLRLLRVSAPGYREEVLSLDISAGRISPVSISLYPDVPRVSFQAPAGTVITLDGQPVSPDQMTALALEPGEHTVTCRIGDYTMTRKFTALRGKVYTVVLSVDLNVSSQP